MSIISRIQGEGEFSGWSFLGLAFKVTGNTPEEIEETVLEFNDRLESLLEKYPEINADLQIPDCIDCFLQSISAAEGQSDQ